MPLPWPTLDWKAAWTDFENQVSNEVRFEFEQLFLEREVIGEGRHDKVIACSLFCKPSDAHQCWPDPTFESVQKIRIRNSSLTWWDAYAGPFLRNLHQQRYVRPDTDVHVYLAADLEWMVRFLRLPQVVIHVMEHASLHASPGMMWRFLAHDLPGIQEIQFVDIEDCWSASHWLRRIDEWRGSGLAVLRHLNPCDWDPVVPDLIIYRPVNGGFWSIRPQSDFSMFKACVAFAWMAQQGRIPTNLQHPVRGSVRMFGRVWPYYGIDETFLEQMVYPFLLNRGIATNYHSASSEVLFPLDLSAVAVACPQSYLTHGF